MPLISKYVYITSRVPKCSSTAMLRLFKQLAAENNFTIVNDLHHDIKNDLRDPNKEIELMETVKKMEKDAVYIRHVWIPDWEKYNLEVNLVNMVRDPISRMASWFYFIRWDAADKICVSRQEKFQKKKKKVDKKTFRSCVLTRDPECLIGGNHTEMLISYFCGYGC